MLFRAAKVLIEKASIEDSSIGDDGMTYLIKVKGKAIQIPTPGTLTDGQIAEVNVSRVFVDEAMEKRIDKTGIIRI